MVGITADHEEGDLGSITDVLLPQQAERRLDEGTSPAAAVAGASRGRDRDGDRDRHPRDPRPDAGLSVLGSGREERQSRGAAIGVTRAARA
jgi:hypothetical protein